MMLRCQLESVADLVLETCSPQLGPSTGVYIICKAAMPDTEEALPNTTSPRFAS